MSVPVQVGIFGMANRECLLNLRVVKKTAPVWMAPEPLSLACAGENPATHLTRLF
jgi:hypothetical protein